MINRILKVIFIFLTVHFVHAGEVIGIMNNEFFTNGERVEGVIKFHNLKADGKTIKYTLQEANTRKHLLSGFIKIANSVAKYEFDLDYKLKSGTYHVDFTVLDNAYVESVLVTLRFLLVNPADESPIKEYMTINKFYTSKIEEGNFINIVKNEQNLKLTSPNTEGIISVSQPPYNLLNLDVNTKIDQAKVDTWQTNIFFNGTVVKGEIPVAQSILGLYETSKDKFFMTKTLPNGNFIFLLDDFEGSDNFQLFPYGDKYNQLSFRTSKSIITNSYEEVPIPNEKLKQIIDDFKNRSAINQYFGVVMPIKPQIQNLRTEAPIKLYKKYIPSNYKVFTYFHQFCKENSLPIFFQEEDKKFKAICLINSAFSKKFNSSSENPLFIVNGVATRNYDALAQIPTAEIETIELYMDFENQRKVYNVYGGDPIIKLRTKTSDNILSRHEKTNFLSLDGFTKDRADGNLYINHNRAKKISPILEPKLFFGQMTSIMNIPLPDIKGEVEILALQVVNGEWKIQKQKINI